MPRKYKSLEGYIRPDAKYGSTTISKFMNNLMWDGKKIASQRVVENALELIRTKIHDKDPVEVFNTALDNIKPRIETKSRRVGGATYQVPVPVKHKRQVALAMKWLIGVARGKKGRAMHLKLADEIMAAFKGEGEAVKKRDDVHRMAESNRAFAHLAY